MMSHSGSYYKAVSYFVESGKVEVPRMSDFLQAPRLGDAHTQTGVSVAVLT